jgi:hypothetical protein
MNIIHTYYFQNLFQILFNLDDELEFLITIYLVINFDQSV